jgi:hypothetical protein
MPDEAPLELVGSEALGALERSHIDMQIGTAKKYPRVMKKFFDEAQGMIALNQETAESCNYRLKRKDKSSPNGVKIIEGPSIRLLEIAATAYGNLRYGSRIIGIDDEFVTSQGMAHDLEKNVAVSVEVKRSIKTKEGARYGTDMIMVTSNAAGSIARRNALNGLIPRSYILHLSDYAKQIAVGDIKSLPERRQRAFDYFTKVLGVDLAKVLAYLEKPSVDDCGLPELDALQGLKTALKDGDTTLEAAFDNVDVTGKAETPDLGGKKEAAPKTATPTTPPAPAASTTAAGATPTASPAETKRTRKKTAEKAPEPENVEKVPEPATAAEPKASAPVLSHQEQVNVLAKIIHEAGVLVDDFCDWLKSSGRGNIYKFDVDAVESLDQLPPQLVIDLLANDHAVLVPCLRMFAPKNSTPAAK